MPVIVAVIGLVAAMIIAISVPNYQLTPGLQIAGVASSTGSTVVTTGGGTVSGLEMGPTITPTSQLPAAVPAEREPILPPTTIALKTAQDVTSSAARLRAQVTVGQEQFESVFFVYGYDESDVRQTVQTARSYQQVVAEQTPGVHIVSARLRGTGVQPVQARVSNLAPDTTYMVYVCGETEMQMLCSTHTSFTTNVQARTQSEADTPRITRTDIDGVSGDTMQLSATVDMNDMHDGIVYVVWGESENRVAAATEASSYNRVREVDEFLQKKRIETDLRGVRSFSVTIAELAAETTHYYAWCVQYDGLDDGVVCTRVRSFTTYDDEFGQAPVVSSALPVVLGDTAHLVGSVSMRGFHDGQVFFAYGTDQSRVSNLSGEQSLSRVRQAGDRLQVVVVDTDFDSSRQTTFKTSVTDLLPDATYYTTLCVEFENQNERYRDAAFITCAPAVIAKTE